VTLAATLGTPEDRADVAAGFQSAVVDTLVIKTRRALRQTGLKRLVVAGGVSANRLLRDELRALAAAEGGKAYFPRLEFCGDNGAMIAFAGCQRLLAGQCEPAAITARPRWPITELMPVG
jgi:N6-L-threonylcarbamoyladenine synthase